MHENLGVTARTENVAPYFEIATKLGMIEDFTVGRKHDLTVFVCQWLWAGIPVESAQPYVREADSPSGIEAVAVRSPVPDDSGHATQRLYAHAGGGSPRNAGYPAHQWLSAEGGRRIESSSSRALQRCRVVIER